MLAKDHKVGDIVLAKDINENWWPAIIQSKATKNNKNFFNITYLVKDLSQEVAEGSLREFGVEGGKRATSKRRRRSASDYSSAVSAAVRILRGTSTYEGTSHAILDERTKWQAQQGPPRTAKRKLPEAPLHALQSPRKRAAGEKEAGKDSWQGSVPVPCQRKLAPHEVIPLLQKTIGSVMEYGDSSRMSEEECKVIESCLEQIILKEVPMDVLVKHKIGLLIKQFYDYVHKNPQMKILDIVARCAFKKLKRSVYGALFGVSKTLQYPLDISQIRKSLSKKSPHASPLQNNQPAEDTKHKDQVHESKGERMEVDQVESKEEIKVSKKGVREKSKKAKIGAEGEVNLKNEARGGEEVKENPKDKLRSHDQHKKAKANSVGNKKNKLGKHNVVEETKGKKSGNDATQVRSNPRRAAKDAQSAGKRSRSKKPKEGLTSGSKRSVSRKRTRSETGALKSGSSKKTLDAKKSKEVRGKGEESRKSKGKKPRPEDERSESMDDVQLIKSVKKSVKRSQSVKPKSKKMEAKSTKRSSSVRLTKKTLKGKASKSSSKSNSKKPNKKEEQGEPMEDIEVPKTARKESIKKKETAKTAKKQDKSFSKATKNPNKKKKSNSDSFKESPKENQKKSASKPEHNQIATITPNEETANNKAKDTTTNKKQKKIALTKEEKSNHTVIS